MVAEVVSVDGNMTHQQAHKCRFWSRERGQKGHWVNLRDTGDERPEGANIECFRRSLVNVKEYWEQ